MSGEELKEAAEAIYSFVGAFDPEEGAKKLKELNRNEGVASKTYNSASVNERYIKNADLSTENGREEAIQSYMALQLKAQESGVMTENDSRRWSELIAKIDDNTINEEELQELQEMRQDTVSHLSIIEKNQKGAS